MAATTETRVWDAVLSTTLANYRQTLHDNIFNDNVVLFWLNMNGKKQLEDGGERIEETLLYGKNTAIQNFQGYQVLNTTPQEGITKAFYIWKEIGGPITISRREQRQNSGKHAIIKLLDGKVKQTELSLKEAVNEQLAGDPSSAASENNGGTNNPLLLSGLSRFAQKDPTTTHNVGGIAQNNESWWRNVQKSATANWVSDRAGLADMRFMYRKTSKGNDHPDFIIGDGESYDAYESMLDPAIRYTDLRFGDAGFINLRFKGAVYTYDEVYENVSTPQTYSTGEGIQYWMNSKYINWSVDMESDFITTPFVRPHNQLAMTAHIVTMAELTCSNRRRLGVLHSIAA